MPIFNLIQHDASPEQIAQGVINLLAPLAAQVRELLTVEELPTSAEIQRRAAAIAALRFLSPSGCRGKTFQWRNHQKRRLQAGGFH